MVLTDVQKRFMSNSPLVQLFIYSIALREERYELLAEINPLVDDNFRDSVKAVDFLITSAEKEKIII